MDKYPVLEEGTIAARIVKEGDDYIVTTLEGEVLGTCGLTKDGSTLKLPDNPANRKWAVIKGVEQSLAEQGYCDLGYKATRTIAGGGSKTPNAKLIAYLSEEEQAQYNAIIERARAAMEADRAANKHTTDPVQKLKDKIAKKQAELDNLMAKLNGVDNDENN